MEPKKFFLITFPMALARRPAEYKPRPPQAPPKKGSEERGGGKSQVLFYTKIVINMEIDHIF